MWESISKNPQFISQYGQFIYGDPKAWYDSLDDELKIDLGKRFGGNEGVLPILEAGPAQPAAPTGYEDYSVQDALNAANNLNTTPVLSGDTNQGVEPVAPIMQDPQRSDAYLGTLSKEKLRELAAAGNLQAAALLQANIPDPVAPPVVDPAQPAAPVLAPRVVPDVDYSDPTLAPLPKPVLVDTTQPKTETTTTTTESEPVLKSGGQGRSTGALSAGSITSSSGPKTSNGVALRWTDAD